MLRTYWADSEGAGVEAMVDDPYSQDPEAEEGDPGDRPLEAASEVEEPESESSTRVPPIDMYADRVGDDVIDDQESKEEEGDEPAKVEETSEVQRKDEAGNETTEPRKVDAQNVGTTKVEQGQAKEEDTPAPEPSTVLTTPPTKDHGSKSSPVSMPPPPVPKKVSKGEVSAEKIAEVKERIDKLKCLASRLFPRFSKRFSLNRNQQQPRHAKYCFVFYFIPSLPCLVSFPWNS